ncbi:MAG: hypothetical protein LBC25_00295 [Holosporales bacterium]|jgi:hypothetical protein|nr:hypothetical protein [Holosporales bacterium]
MASMISLGSQATTTDPATTDVLLKVQEDLQRFRTNPEASEARLKSAYTLQAMGYTLLSGMLFDIHSKILRWVEITKTGSEKLYPDLWASIDDPVKELSKEIFQLQLYLRTCSQ